MLIYFSPSEEQTLYQVYLEVREMGEWGPYDALTLTQKYYIFLRRLRGVACG